MSKWSWLIVLTILILGAIVAGCNVNPQPAGLTPIPKLSPAATITLLPELQGGNTSGATGGTGGNQAGDAAVGVALYMRNCSPCHGAQAEGAVGPALRNDQFIKSGDQQVFSTISNGRPGTAMPAWLMDNGGPFTQSNINDVIAWLHTIQGVPPIPKATEPPAEPTETPLPANAPTPEPAQPSNPGNPGPAATLNGDAKKGMAAFGQNCAACHGPEGVQGVPNPGTEDGSVPPLNPIDPTIIDKDPKKFAANVDIFIEHGSVPDGDAPTIAMPAFGDRKLLPDQTIADIIAYVISLNSQK